MTLIISVYYYGEANFNHPSGMKIYCMGQKHPFFTEKEVAELLRPTNEKKNSFLSYLAQIRRLTKEIDLSAVVPLHSIAAHCE